MPAKLGDAKGDTMPETRTLKTVMLDVGKLRKREIMELKQGSGPIVDEARTAAEGTTVSTTTMIPIVIVYEKRRKKRGGLAGLLRNK